MHPYKEGITAAEPVANVTQLLQVAQLLQIDGTVMGTHMAPQCASIFMAD